MTDYITLYKILCNNNYAELREVVHDQLRLKPDGTKRNLIKRASTGIKRTYKKLKEQTEFERSL